MVERLRLSLLLTALAASWHLDPELGWAKGLAPVSSRPAERPLTLALRYVAFLDNQGRPVVKADDVRTALKTVNKMYAPCQVQFDLEEFLEVEPAKEGLPFRPAKLLDFTPIRRTFQNLKTLLLVGTGAWHRPKNGLGKDGSNAWTMMPGEKLQGTILEASVAGNSGLIGHELGHYLNLDHEADDLNLMNPVIYKRSTRLSEAQCQTARNTAVRHWMGALRDSLRADADSSPDRSPAGDRST